MIQAISNSLTFEEFLEQHPDDGKRYELINGQIVELMATREHDDIADFIQFSLNDEVRRLRLNYKITRTASVKVNRLDGLDQGRTPDVSVIDKALWKANPKDYSALREPIQLAVEVASTNWRDDYLTKLREYEELGIPEYWIVDYLALGAIRYIGAPKKPTISIYVLIEGEYQVSQFRDRDRLISPTFPELNLTVEQVLKAGE
jgi:Uma2 family endonuclease